MNNKIKRLPARHYFACLLLALCSSIGHALAIDVKGKVTDSSSAAIQGVTVTVKGKKIVTTTGADGAFAISAETGSVLVFSYVGFNNTEVTVSADFLTVVLREKKEVLNDVVVVGYGKGTRRTISSAIVSVKPEDLNKGAIGDVGQLLQGKVPGLNITASGDPNKPAAVILRGASTINSPGAPFYVIDGIPGADIAAIAPDDIASIDVLKDAAATAIYGNRAASGIIMVTTKRGRKGAVRTAYSGYVGLESISNSLDLMNADELRAYITANNNALSPNDDLGANTDWMKSIQRESAISHNHNLSFSGGTEHSTYSASINYFNKEGILEGSRLRRIIGRLSAEQYAFNDHVKFGLNVSNSNNSANYVPLQNIVLLQAAKHLPVSPVKNADGTYFENLNTTGY